MNLFILALLTMGALVGIKMFTKYVLCLGMAAATAAVTNAKVQGPYGGSICRRTEKASFAADTGTLYNGVLVGKNSDGYYMKASDGERLTDLAVYVGQNTVVDSSEADGTTTGPVERGVVVPVTISTLGTEAAARAAHSKPAYVLYDNEVRLTPGTYRNLAGIIVDHESLTLVDVFVPVVAVVPVLSDTTTQIWVDANNGDDTTGDGSRAYPKKTIEAAYALKSATRNTMFLLPGTYLPAATLTLPAYDFKFIGIGGPELVIIGGTAAAAHLFTKAAGALTATTTYMWQDLDLYNGDTYDAIRVDNTTAGKKIFIVLRNCEQEGAGIPVNVHTHGDTGNAVKIVADGGAGRAEWEGELYFVPGNTSDLIDIRNVRLTGGFKTSTAAVAFCTFLENCIIPATHATGGESTQVVNVGACYTQSTINYTKAVAADIGGSQTVRICTGVAA